MLRAIMNVRLAAAMTFVFLSLSPSFSSEMASYRGPSAPAIKPVALVSSAQIPLPQTAVIQSQASSEKRKCGRGRYLSDGHCCPRGTVWNGKRCLRNPGLQPDCPRGTAGIFPNCRAVRAPACPAGTTGRFPNCTAIRTCPGGTTGRYPNCRPYLAQRCPAGTRGNYPSCQPIVRLCPPGYVGTPPLCRRINQRPVLTPQPRLSPRLPSAGQRPAITPQPRLTPRLPSVTAPRPSIQPRPRTLR